MNQVAVRLINLDFFPCLLLLLLVSVSIFVSVSLRVLKYGPVTFDHR